jgi:hypothetical protein
MTSPFFVSNPAYVLVSFPAKHSRSSLKIKRVNYLWLSLDLQLKRQMVSL